MLAVLPLACFALIFVTVLAGSRRGIHPPDLRSSFLSASVVWGVTLTAITEILSLPHLLTRGWLSAAWASACLASAAVYYRIVRRQGVVTQRDSARAAPAWLMALSSGAGFIIAAVGLIALLAPPNTWDSMTYHMSRVVHWIQNQSVAHYPTHIPRQLHHTPWAEFAIMHFQLLTSSDRLANCVQWFSMAGSILGISLIARQLGAGLLGQVFAAVVTATIPMGVLQGSSTQNDYVVSFWLVCLVYHVLLAIREGGSSWGSNIALGASLGIAVLTKSTAYVYALPFVTWALLATSKRLRWGAWKPVVAIALVALALNLGHYSRNIQLYGSVHGDTRAWYMNDVTNAKVVISNVIRNLTLHVGTPFGVVNEAIDGGTQLFLTALGIDPNDRRTTWLDEDFRVTRSSNHEDSAGNPMHLLLLLVSIAIYLSSRQSKPHGNDGRYIVACTFAFLLFCLTLKWQPWHSRLHLPLFVLSAAFIARILAVPARRKLVIAAAVLLIVAAQPWVFYNYSRPLIPLAFQVGDVRTIGGSNAFADRADQYFSNRPELKAPYVGAADLIKSKNCSTIGLHLGLNDWEYPFWALLQQDSHDVLRLEHVNVENSSAETASATEEFIPCAVISLGPDGGASDEFTINQQRYAREWSLGPVRVYLK